ncbi:hypothetical protein ASA1KI_21050 [Opitutales bacterium ASA1]|uniref:hypothetical protein n=1 Tax=Congregicoccus parvus TaxID=3081749 RepID=UPI002B2ED358|nr:hypothetical protein ASA1KI_21050 [Opitutales bacterium ASA1]
MNTATATETPLQQIEAQAKVFSKSRDVLAERVQSLQMEVENLRRRRIPGIKSAAYEAGEQKAELERLIAASPELFVKPRTITVHGIRLGLEKGKGAIEFGDEEGVIKRIGKVCPELRDILVKTTEKLVKKALKQLDAATLAKIGCTVQEIDDQVVVRVQGDEIDKLVAKILEESGGGDAGDED